MDLFNKTILMNPFVAAAAAIMTLVGAIGIFNSYQEKARKATIDADKEIIK